MPAMSAFCTSSKLARPLTRIRSVAERACGSPAFRRRLVCRPRCGGRRLRAAAAAFHRVMKSAAACRPPVRSKTGWARRRASGRRWITAADRPPANRAAARGSPACSADGFDGSLAADAATRGGVEVALQPVEIDFDAGFSSTVTELPTWRGFPLAMCDQRMSPDLARRPGECLR